MPEWRKMLSMLQRPETGRAKALEFILSDDDRIKVKIVQIIQTRFPENKMSTNKSIIGKNENTIRKILV